MKDVLLHKLVNCRQCVFYDTCKKYNSVNKPCYSFSPSDTDKFCAWLEEKLKSEVEPSHDKRMKVCCIDESSKGITYDFAFDYRDYVGLVNDDLKVIRSGGIAYAFQAEQVRDIFRYEKNAHIINWDNGVYYISL